MPRGQQTGRSRANLRAPRVPRQQEPPKTPRYNVQEIQSIRTTPKKRPWGYNNRVSPKDRSYVPATGSTMARRELTPQEMGGLYPQLISKRPELLNRLAKRGVTYHVDPLLAQRDRMGGYYSPSSREVVVQQGMPPGVAAHETVHAYQATSWVNPARFLLDKRYRAARVSDLVISGDTAIGKALGLYLLAAGGNVGGRVARASYQSEVFAMGAYGEGAYPDLPVDYTEANYLFGGSFER